MWKDDATETDKNKKTESDNDDASAKVSSWLRARYESLWESLSAMLGRSGEGEESLNEFALVGAFRLMRAAHRRKEKRRRDREGDQGELVWKATL